MAYAEEKRISVLQLGEILNSEDGEFIILDVREAWELQRAKLADPRVIHIPLGSLSSQIERVLRQPEPDHPPIYVVCHHGIRSAAVARWLQGQGWDNSYNVVGGLEAYAAAVDPTIGRY
jgi:rhodanese-related sulfurtransferase